MKVYLEFYSSFKQSLQFENYLTHLPLNLALNIYRLRSCNFRFPIETLAWQGVEHNQRRCPLCMSDLGDSYHYVLSCQNFINHRKQFLPRYYCHRPSMLKFTELVNTENRNVLLKLSKFAKFLMQEVKF